MNAQTVERFWSKVRRLDDEGCWLWTASKRNKGYGAFVWADATGAVIQGRAHRFSWELHFGPIPQGLCVLHKCDVPACVNPHHLFLGTIADNNRDMAFKERNRGKRPYGKYKRGTAHPGAKLTDDAVRSMRASRLCGLSYNAIAAEFGVNPLCAYRAITRKTWGHVE
jgi:hypothetical protein